MYSVLEINCYGALNGNDVCDGTVIGQL